MTETSPLATVARAPKGTNGERQWELRACQGRPVCGVEIRLRGDDGRTLPWDGRSIGEIQARGPWVTGSYFGDNDSDKLDEGWLRTGDVGRIDQHGYLTLTDRVKDVIKSGGEWISSVDLENALVAHPAVHEAVVIGVPDEVAGKTLGVDRHEDRNQLGYQRIAGLPGRRGRQVVDPGALGVHC